MSSILTAVFKATIGLLVNKGRDKAAEKLKEGDVTDQMFRNLVVREIDDIKSKLDGISRKDLKASVSFFEEGFQMLCHVLADVATQPEESSSASASDCKALAVVQRKRDLELILDKSAKEKLANAKDRFKDARREATRAFNNESLKLSDRILAMKYRVMATILEALDNYMDVFPACQVCLKELHALAEVQKNFKAQLEKPFMSRFGKDDRVEIISSVCHINHVIYEVFRVRGIFNSWAFIDIGQDIKIDPLREGRVEKVLRSVGLEHYCLLSWSFGMKGAEEENKLLLPRDIAINSKEDFFVMDRLDNKIKVFDKHGEFMYFLDPKSHLDVVDTSFNAMRMAIDGDDNMYVLMGKVTGLPRENDGNDGHIILVFDKLNILKKTLRLGALEDSLFCSCIAINSRGNVFICTYSVVYFFDCDANLLCTLSVSDYEDDDAVLCDIAAADDRVYVTVQSGGLHIFTSEGEHIRKIELDILYPWVAVHRESGHVLIADCKTNAAMVYIYTESGDFIHRVLWNYPLYSRFPLRLAVGPDGQIAVSMAGIGIWLCGNTV